MTNTELKEYMQEHNLTQRALARLLEIEETQVSRWVTGRHKISRAWQALLDEELFKKESS